MENIRCPQATSEGDTCLLVMHLERREELLQFPAKLIFQGLSSDLQRSFAAMMVANC